MFETTLMASNPHRDARHRFAALAAAVTVHALVMGFLTVSQLWAVDPVREYVVVPPLVVHFPPPLGGGRTADRQAGRSSNPRQVPQQQVVQPALVPEGTPRARDPETPFDGPHVPGLEGLTNGESTGPGIDTGPEQVDTDASAVVEAPRRIGGDVRAPVAIARSAPLYPEVARRMRIQGVVRVEAVIDERGNVVDARVLDDIGMGCGQAAVEAIRTWRYEPATLNGRPVSVYLEVRVSFRLRGTG
jgi:protein TonB